MRRDPHPPVGQVLVVDAGSSLTKLALASGEDMSRLGSFATVGDGIAGWPARLAAAVGRSAGAIGHVALSSVPPDLPALLGSRWAPPGRDPVPVRVVGPGSVDLPVAYRSPSGLGADRLANAVAAVERWGAPVVVVDVGTAITCDLVGPGPRFAGGAIAPGPRAAYAGLVGAAPHLAQPGGLAVDGELPLVPATTAEAVRVGILRGAAALVDGLARGYHGVAGPCPVVVTGGLGAVVARECDTVTAVDPDLTLRGILLATRGGARPVGERLKGAA